MMTQEAKIAWPPQAASNSRAARARHLGISTVQGEHQLSPRPGVGATQRSRGPRRAVLKYSKRKAVQAPLAQCAVLPAARAWGKPGDTGMLMIQVCSPASRLL